MKKVVLSIVLTLAIMGGTLAFASELGSRSNNSATAYSFTFTPELSTNEYTDVRHKEDASSAYMKLERRSRAQEFTASVVDANNGNFSQTWFVVIRTVGAEYFIPNTAYEDQGYGVNVKIRAHTGDLFGFDASGVWSPDSVRYK